MRFWKNWKLLVPLCVVLGFGCCLFFHWYSTTSLVFVVRHAEKGSPVAMDPPGPHLSDAGSLRATALAQALGDCGMHNVYVTEFIRTQETAQPLATRLGLTPVQTPKADLDSLISMIRSNDRGSVALVVGHSDSAPEIIRRLSGLSVPAIGETQFDNLYLVIMPRCGPSRVLRMKYGVPTI